MTERLVLEQIEDPWLEDVEPGVDQIGMLGLFRERNQLSILAAFDRAVGYLVALERGDFAVGD